VTIELGENATKWIVKKGYDEKFGARPMARIIQEYIKKPLAEELLFGKLENGGIVKIATEGEGEDQKLAFEYLPADPAARQAKIKAEEEDDDDDVVDDDPPADALVGAGPKRSLSGPKKPSGAVPSVPRRRKDD